MDPFVAWMTVALAGLGGYAAYITKRYINHLESDLAYSRRTAQRGVETAEKATAIAERKARAG